MYWPGAPPGAAEAMIGPTWGQTLGYGLGGAYSLYSGFNNLFSGGNWANYLGGGIQVAGGAAMGASALGLAGSMSWLGPVGAIAGLAGGLISSLFGGKDPDDDADLHVRFGYPADRWKKEFFEGRPEWTTAIKGYGTAPGYSEGLLSINIKKGDTKGNWDSEVEKAVTQYYDAWFSGLSETMQEKIAQAMLENPFQFHENDYEKWFKEGGEQGLQKTIEKINEELFKHYADVFRESTIEDIEKTYSKYLAYFTSGFKDQMKSAISGVKSADELAEISSQYVSTIQQAASIIDQLEYMAMDETEQRLHDINAQFDQMRATLEALGVDLSKVTLLEEQRQQQIQQVIQSQEEQVASIIDQLEYMAMDETEQRLHDINAQFDQMRATLEALGADLSKVTLLEEQRQQQIQQVIQSQARAATDAAFDAVQRAIQAAAQESERAITSAYEARRKSLEAQIESARAARDVANESLDSLRDIFDLLKDQIADLRGDAGAGMTPAQGLAFIDQSIATARATGYMPDRDALSEAIAAARSGLRAENYATSFELRRDRLVLAGKLGDLQSLVGKQMTVAERHLDVAEDQLDLLKSQLEQARVQYEEELARNQAYYDQILENAQQQIDTLRGIDNGVLSVSKAINNLATAIREEAAASAAAAAASAAASISANNIREEAAASAAASISANNSIDSLIKNAYASIGRIGFGNTVDTIDQEGYNYWKTQLESGAITVEHFNDAFKYAVDKYIAEKPNDPYSQYMKSVRGYASGGYYPGGLALVGEEGPELINFKNPGMVYTAEQTAAILSGGGSGVASELRQLREENRAQARAIAQLQSRIARMLERWDADGLPEERVVTA
jgi:hypothetical protein